jgi:hypothetical protein
MSTEPVVDFAKKIEELSTLLAAARGEIAGMSSKNTRLERIESDIRAQRVTQWENGISGFLSEIAQNSPSLDGGFVESMKTAFVDPGFTKFHDFMAVAHAHNSNSVSKLNAALLETEELRARNGRLESGAGGGAAPISSTDAFATSNKRFRSDSIGDAVQGATLGSEGVHTSEQLLDSIFKSM